MRYLLGLGFIILGIAGIILPILPGIPFLVIGGVLLNIIPKNFVYKLLKKSKFNENRNNLLNRIINFVIIKYIHERKIIQITNSDIK